MGYYINSQIGYYEGDRISEEDISVPQRPDCQHEWTGDAWEKIAVATTQDDPVLKLRNFLAANPDVAAIIGLG